MFISMYRMYHMLCPLPAGLRFEEIVDAGVWHSDVRFFSVFDLSSGELLGYFYLDMYTRFTHYFEFTFYLFLHSLL